LTLDPAIGWLIVVSLAALFGAAAVHKLNSAAEFAKTLEAYRLLPQKSAPWAARLLPFVELVICLGLLVPASRRPACLVAGVTLAIYAGAIGINLARGRLDLDCGCGVARDRQPIGSWMLLRNGALAAAALAAGLPWTGRLLRPIDVLTVAAGAVAAALLYASVDVLLGRVVSKAAMARAG
jgi:hypothetical protein